MAPGASRAARDPRPRSPIDRNVLLLIDNNHLYERSHVLIGEPCSRERRTARPGPRAAARRPPRSAARRRRVSRSSLLERVRSRSLYRTSVVQTEDCNLLQTCVPPGAARPGQVARSRQPHPTRNNNNKHDNNSTRLSSSNVNNNNVKRKFFNTSLTLELKVNVRKL